MIGSKVTMIKRTKSVLLHTIFFNVLLLPFTKVKILLNQIEEEKSFFFRVLY